MLTVDRERYMPFMSGVFRFLYHRFDRCYLRVDIFISSRNQLLHSLNFYPASIKSTKLGKEEKGFDLCQRRKLVEFSAKGCRQLKRMN